MNQSFATSFRMILIVWSSPSRPRPRWSLITACATRLGRSRRSMPASACCCRCSSSARSEEHTSELQSRQYIVCRLLLEKKTNHLSDPDEHTYPSSPAVVQPTHASTAILPQTSPLAALCPLAHRVVTVAVSLVPHFTDAS